MDFISDFISMIGSLYMASILSLKTYLQMFLFSLNVGVNMSFSTEKGSARRQMFFGFSRLLRLF